MELKPATLTRTPGRHSCWSRLSFGSAAALVIFAGATVLASLVTSAAAATTSYQVLVGDGDSGAVYALAPGATSATVIPGPVSGTVRALTPSPDGSLVYVDFSSGEVAILTTTSDSYTGTPIDLGSGTDPGAMLVTPNGQDLYVAEEGTGQVVEIDLTTGQPVGSPITTGPALNLAISPDGTSLFVDGGSQGSSVTVIATATNTESGSPIAVPAPGAMVLSPTGSQLYVLSDSNTASGLEEIDTATDSLTGSPIALPSSVQSSGMALSSDGSELYLADSSLEQLDVLDLSTGVLGAPPGTLPAGFVPAQIGASPDGATAYLDGTGATGTAELVQLNLGGEGTDASITLGSGVDPVGLALAPAAVNSVPTPTPTPTPVCSPPVGIGPVIISPPIAGYVAGSPASSTAMAGASPSSSSSGNIPTPTSSTSSGASSSVPNQVSPPAHLSSSSPLPSPMPSTGPIVCFGAESLAPRAQPPASLAEAAGAVPPSGVLLPASLAVLALAAGGLMIFGRRSWWRLPRFPQWRTR